MKPRDLPSLARSAGFTMIEVLVTLVILLFGLLGLAGLTMQAQQGEVESYQRVQAMVLLQDMVGRISANRSVAACYAITATNTGSPYYGTGAAALTACSSGTINAYERANADMAAWSNLLTGSSETLSSASVGAMVGARGCVSSIGTNIYLVTVVWQGRNPSSAPNSGLTCGTGLYGSETYRRAVSATVRVPTLS